MRAREIDFHVGPLLGGFTLYPYQVAFGVSLRYWPCIFAPSVRVHIGPFKVWLGLLAVPSKGENGVSMR